MLSNYSDREIERFVVIASRQMQARLSATIRQMELPYRRILSVLPTLIISQLCNLNLLLIARRGIGSANVGRKNLLCQLYCAFVAPQLDRNALICEPSLQQLFELEKHLRRIRQDLPVGHCYNELLVMYVVADGLAEGFIDYLQDAGWWELSDQEKDLLIKREIAAVLRDGIVDVFKQMEDYFQSPVRGYPQPIACA